MERKSGVLMHVSSLWGDYKIGSFGKEAREFIDFIKSCGFSIWQVLPFCLPDDCNSPYKSFGAFSGNFYFIDLPTLYEKGLITKGELLSQKQTSPYLCEFISLKKDRFSLLETASKRFKDIHKMSVFYEENPQIYNFCKFMALKKANGNLPFNLWKVFTSRSILQFFLILSFKFLVASLVNEIHSISSDLIFKTLIRYFTLPIIVVDLPDPAPATIIECLLLVFAALIC